MTEQERAEQLDRALDRLFAGENIASSEPLLDIAQVLAGDLVQPSHQSVSRLEQQIKQWFGPVAVSKPPVRPVRRLWPLISVAAGVLIVTGFAVIVVSGHPPGATPPPTAIAAALTPVATEFTVGPPSSPSSILTASPVSTSRVTATTSPGTPSAAVLANTPCSASANAATQNADDSSALPILLSLSGPVQASTLSAIRINDLIVRIPAEVSLPATVQAGSLVTIRGDLCNDDTILASTVISGVALSPLISTAPASSGTSTTAPPSACDASDQPLAALLSTSYTVPYADIVGWYCKGFAYGVIARAYRLAIIAAGQNKPIAVADILAQRLAGKGWASLIAQLEIRIPPESGLIPTRTPGAVTDIPTSEQDHATPSALSTQPPGTALSVTSVPYVAVIVEGPIESIKGGTVVVYGQRVKLQKNDPVLTKLKVGNWVKISGSYGTDDDQVTIIIVAVTVTVIEAPAALIGPAPAANGNGGGENDGGHPRHNDD